MKNAPLPGREQIERLTGFLPRLYAQGFQLIRGWEGGGPQKDGSWTLAYPRYDPLVEEFFGVVARDGWLDYEYDPEQSYAWLKDEEAVRGASLAQIRSMLTFCVRGERFGEGHWAQMIEQGYIRRLLERLNAIKAEQQG